MCKYFISYDDARFAYREKKLTLSLFYFLAAAKICTTINQSRARERERELREKFRLFSTYIVITACEFFKLSQPIWTWTRMYEKKYERRDNKKFKKLKDK